MHKEITVHTFDLRADLKKMEDHHIIVSLCARVWSSVRVAMWSSLHTHTLEGFNIGSSLSTPTKGREFRNFILEEVSTIVRKRADHLKKLGVPTTWRPSEPCFPERKKEQYKKQKYDPPSLLHASVRIKRTYHKLWLTTVVVVVVDLCSFQCQFFVQSDAPLTPWMLVSLFYKCFLFGLPLCTSFLHIFPSFWVISTWIILLSLNVCNCVCICWFFLFALGCYLQLTTISYWHPVSTFFRCLLCCSVLVLRAFSFCHNAGWPMGVVQVAISGSYQ